MTTTLTRIAMALPIAAALLALTSGWAEAKTGPDFPGDIVTNQPIVDPQPPKPPKWQDVPDIDLGDITVDPDPQPPADDPAPPADTDDDSDHDDNEDHGSHGPKGGTTVRPTSGKAVPVVAETDTAFDANAAGEASEQIAPKYVSAGVQQVPAGLVFGLGALLVAVIGWAAFRHHRLSV